ncbi:hypothetical protein KQH60_00260 [Mycetohabitans sp. B8]|uniref:hypothetical protein n=1 Tax=Mycetohabitans sp. B8 TaxID=2841845 RepID=UPI001F1C0B1F|nr:hypothetical protein [Mycetohabitans sp. B8]MCG1041080.1 hypothetical protein [Mycetohabitans sp. B8]
MEGETVVGLIGGGLGLLILLSLWGFELLSRWREHPERSRVLHWMETRHLAGWLRRHH